MKKYFYIMAASIAALVSCNKDTSVPEQDPSKEEKCTFCVSAIADSTKTSLGENGTTVIWDEGEPIALWDARTSGQGISFKMVSITSTKVAAEFAGEVPGGTTDYYVLAPYDGNAVFNKDNSTITSTIAAEQYMRNGSFESGKSLSFGIGKREPKQTEGDGVTFSNVCSIIKFKIPAYVQATSVVISANDKGDLAGTAVISVSEQKITSVSGSKTVTVYSNDVSSGNDTYYAVVAPRTYENGLTFQVQTSGGNSYSCKTTKNIPATGGVIYNIGSLGLKLDGKIEPTVSIEHNYSGGLLTGSTAVLTNEVAPELASMVKSWTITLKKGGVDYATINSASGTMTNVSGKPYLPQGSYDLEVKYTPQSGSERTLNFTNKGTSPAPNNVNATISHNYSGGVLTGSTAKLGDGTATSATEGLTYTLKKGNTAYATYVTTSAGGVMTNVSGKPYIPQGDYDLEISQTGDNLTFTSTSPAPKDVLGVSVSGYTSYSAYIGSDGQTKSSDNANGMDGSTVYGVDATFSGLSDAVAAQCATKTFTYDGNNTSAGNKTGQTWAAHTIYAKYEFDGLVKEASKTVNVTGLPFQRTPPKNKNEWDLSGNYSTTSNDYLELGGNHGGGGTPTAKSTDAIAFNVPNDINTKVRAHIKTCTAYATWIWRTTTFKFLIGSSEIISCQSSESTSEEDRGYQEGNGTLTSSVKDMTMKSTYMGIQKNTYVRIYDLQVLYR